MGFSWVHSTLLIRPPCLPGDCVYLSQGVNRWVGGWVGVGFWVVCLGEGGLKVGWGLGVGGADGWPSTPKFDTVTWVFRIIDM